MDKDKKLPIYGVGPIYGILVIVLTLTGVILTITKVLDFSKVEPLYLRIIFITFGVILFIYGLIIWIACALGKNSIDKYIKEGKLYTNGFYKYCRNPIYTGILFMVTGVLLVCTNYLLLILPILYYIFLTVLMINTEEKWLKEKFKDEYIEYAKKTNRCIPWFKRK